MDRISDWRPGPGARAQKYADCQNIYGKRAGLPPPCPEWMSAIVKVQATAERVRVYPDTTTSRLP